MITFSTASQLSWAIAFMLCVPFALIFFASPKVALMGFIVLRTTLNAFGPNFVLAEIGGTPFYLHMAVTLEFFILLSGLIIFSKVARNFRFQDHSLLIPVVLFSLNGLIAIFFAHNIFFAFAIWLRYILWIIFTVSILMMVRSRKDIEWFITIGMIAAILPVVSVLWDLAGGINVGSYYGINDIRGWYTTPPALAGMLFAVLPFVTFKMLHYRDTKNKSLGKYLAIFLFHGLLIGIFYAYYRTIWLATIVFLVTIYYFIRPSKIYTLVLVLSLVFLSWQNWQFIRYKMRDSPLQHIEKLVSDSPKIQQTKHAVLDYGAGRVRIWKNVINAWIDSSVSEKIFGQGMLASTRHAGRHIATGSLANAHNDFLELLISQGVIGLALFLWFFYEIIRRILVVLRRSEDPYYRNLAVTSLALLVGCFFPMMTSVLLTTLSIMFYVGMFLGLTLAAAELRRNASGGLMVKKEIGLIQIPIGDGPKVIG